MDHLRKAHAVPKEVKTADMGQWFPPWTAWREVWTDALKPGNSGNSTDVLLFSGLNLGLVHHYIVFQKGAAHVSLRRDYLQQVRVFVSQAAALVQCGWPEDVSPSPTTPACSGSPKLVRQRDSDEESLRKARRLAHRIHTTRVKDISADVLSPVAISDWDPDAILYDCRPRILPVSISVRGPRAPCIIGSPASSSLAALPGEVGSAAGVSGGGTGCRAGARIGIL